MVQRPHKTRILSRTHRVVVKVGSGTLSSTDGIKRESVAQLVRGLARLHAGHVGEADAYQGWLQQGAHRGVGAGLALVW